MFHLLFSPITHIMYRTQIDLALVSTPGKAQIPSAVGFV